MNWKAQAKEEEKGGEKGGMKDQLKDKKVKCRICSGEHFTARCPFKDTMAPVEETVGAGAGAGEDGASAGALGGGTASYVPPHLRKGAGAAGEKMGGKYEKDDLATLRVTNVSRFPSSISGLIFSCFFCLNNDLTLHFLRTYRSASWQRSKKSGICSSGSVVSPECSWPETEKLKGPRALLSSVLQIAAMPHVPAKKWMAVRTMFPSSPAWQGCCILTCLFLVGYRHLILRVEFAKRST